MSAELLAMLDAARALHERAEHAPSDCVTCSTNDRYAPWPCDTAKALGATGRSEWKNPGPAPCDVAHAHAESYPCVLNSGHDGSHVDRDGDVWD